GRKAVPVGSSSLTAVVPIGPPAGRLLVPGFKRTKRLRAVRWGRRSGALAPLGGGNFEYGGNSGTFLSPCGQHAAQARRGGRGLPRTSRLVRLQQGVPG